MPEKSRAIVLTLACLLFSGCSSRLLNWSTDEVAWLSGFVLVLTGLLVYWTNRLTLQGASPSRGIGPVICLAGLFFLIWGSKLNLIHAYGSDVPFWDQWDMEGRLYPSVLNGAMNPFVLLGFHNEHRPLLIRVLSITLLKLNGQWDPIIQMFVDSILYSLILTGLCLVLWRLAGRRNLPVFCLMIGIIGVRHFSWESTLWVSALGFYFLLVFTFISIVLLLFSKPFTVVWHLGLFATLLGEFSVGSGFLTPFAVACVMLFNCMSGARDWKKSSMAIIALAAVAVLEFLLVPVSPGAVFSKFNLLGTLMLFSKIAAWPAFTWVLGPIFWFPFLILIRRQFRAKSTSPLIQFLLASGVWVLLQAV